MIYPFAALKNLRDKLASVPAFEMNAALRLEIVEAIEELDNAMVAEKRAEYAGLPGVPHSVRLEREQIGFINNQGLEVFS